MSLTAERVTEPVSRELPPELAARLDAARQVLATAEAEVGVRARLEPPDVVSLPPAQEGTGEEPDEGRRVDPEQALAVPGGLAPLFPDGMRRGGAVQVLGSTSVLLSLAAGAMSGGAWCAMVGLPDLGLAAAAELGLPLERTVVVPRPGPDLAGVLGALVDGVDVVVLGSAGSLLDRERRTIGSRIRVRGAVMLTAGPWPGADTVLEVTPRAWHGVGQGSGVLRSGEVTITARHRRGDLTRALHARRGLQGWGPVPAVPAVSPLRSLDRPAGAAAGTADARADARLVRAG
ncbi:hypothetical protein LQF12_07130 [Ruania suaedae]|uniref:hypothetical protein n=1 Tax=Ruania suaedae TaxID=2897774 RepID=UPI001E2D56DE|nr:hypothetical protein [Ruania suaedae]UFU04345.1 hypothetical protein LQF12_07130 [Ruania suaedae]